MDPAAGAALAGLAPFRADRRPGYAGAPGEAPWGAPPVAPVWLEALIRFALQAAWAAAAAAGGAQLTLEMVGGDGGGERSLPHRVARAMEKLEALVEQHERSAAAAGAGLWAGVAISVCGGLAVAGWLWLSWPTVQPHAREDVRARTLLELAEAVDQEGDEAIRRIASAAGTDAEVVRAWHVAWCTAWRGPSAP